MKENTTTAVEGLIIPKECVCQEMENLETQIKTKIDALVDLITKRREHESAIQSDMSNEKQSLFVGYAIDQKHNQRSYHFVAGQHNALDPLAVQLLTALYATQPKYGNKKTPKVIKKTKHESILRSKQIKSSVKHPSDQHF